MHLSTQEWQKKWENFQDPLARGQTSQSDTATTSERLGSARSTRSVTKVWVIPEHDEENEVLSAWDKVSLLWNATVFGKPRPKEQHLFTHNGHI